MAGINLPKISAPTAGEVGRLNPMKAPGTPKLVTYKAPKTVAKQTNPYDTFNVADPYNAAKIPSLANSSYASDVANAKTDAAMGYLTQAQRDAQAGNQAANVTSISNALAQQIAGIQQATVAQGNASGAALGAQNTATGSSGAGVAGLAGVAAPAGVSAPAVNAVLGTQNAATGNLYGGLQSAALASGAQNAKQAYANEAVNVQNDQLSQQKELASLLAGIASPSAREATYTSANTSVDAANKATDLTIWTGLENRALTAQAEGDKVGEAEAQLAEKKFEAGLSSADKLALGKLSATTSRANNAATVGQSNTNNLRTTGTSRANSLTAAASKIAAAKRASATPAARLALSRALAAVDKGAGTRVPGAVITYTVLAQPPTPTINGKTVPGTAKPKPITIPITTADFQSGAWKTKLPKGYTALNTPTPGKTGPTGVTSVPSAWTTYNRRLGIIKSQFPGITQGAAVQYLAQAGYKQPGKK